MKNYLLSILSLMTISNAQAQQNPIDWLKTVPVTESVHIEMYKFFAEEDPSNKQVNAYIANFIPTFHNQMVNETAHFLQQLSISNTCKPAIEVSFPKQITNDFSFDSKEEFESNFVKVQSNACLGKLNIDKVFQTLMSEKFQRNVIDGLKAIQFPTENRVCVATKTFFLSTNYCVTKQFLKTQTQYVIQSFNDANNGNQDKIFFKDTINVITQLPNGDVSFYNLMYARSKGISGIVKGGIRSNAKETYEKVRDNLIGLSK